MGTNEKFDGGVVGGRLRGVLLVVVVLGLLALLPASALGGPKPKVALSFPNAAEGAPLTFNWTARHLGGVKKLVIQRPFGTAHVWKTVQRLKGTGGSGLLPGQSLGSYRYRIAAVRGRFVLAAQVATAHVYGQVPFSTLFRNGEYPSGVYTTPTGSFPYVGSGPGSLEHMGNTEDGEVPSTMFSVAHNRCSTVHLTFVLGGTGFLGKSPAFTGTVSLVQQTREAVSASVPFNQTGSIDTELIPGQTWSVIASYVGHDEEWVIFTPTLYFNGYAVCDSAEPFLQ